MILDDFKVAALAKNEGLKEEYKVIMSVDEGDGMGYHVLSVRYNDIKLYIDFETDKEHGFSFEYVSEIAQEEMDAFNEALVYKTKEEQLGYIMGNYTNIFANQCEKYGLRFDNIVVRKIEEFVLDLINKNKEDFVKTYKELEEFASQEKACFEVGA